MSAICCWQCMPSMKDVERTIDPKNQIVDLKEVLCNNVWERYYKKLTKFEKLFLKREYFTIDVPDRFFVFEHHKTEVFDTKPKDEKPQATIKEDTDVKEPRTQPCHVQGITSKGVASSDTVSLETFFGNDTPERQTYKFRIEKTRKSVISVSVQRGFTFGGTNNLSISLQKDSSLGIERDLHFQVTKTDGETFEETILTEATSDIIVGPHSHCTASVSLEEKPFYKKFEVTTRMSMPKEEAVVYIRRKFDGKAVYFSVIRDLTIEFNKDNVYCMEVVRENDVISQSKMDFKTSGVLQGTLVCNHRILLKSENSL
ncbi:unnamed protein product [Lymnaea stagnalis]|uniref:Uncharacterized protein n=1 Tax=Lymnaea stagnalis TaxID=6523 RepID=A0AAV2IK01_LYMST